MHPTALLRVHGILPYPPASRAVAFLEDEASAEQLTGKSKQLCMANLHAIYAWPTLSEFTRMAINKCDTNVFDLDEGAVMAIQGALNIAAG